jgi:hypothetical protein
MDAVSPQLLTKTLFQGVTVQAYPEPSGKPAQQLDEFLISNASNGRSLASRFRDPKHDTCSWEVHPGCASHENDNAVSWQEDNTYVFGEP